MIVRVILIKLNRCQNLLQLCWNVSWKSAGNLSGCICIHPELMIVVFSCEICMGRHGGTIERPLDLLFIGRGFTSRPGTAAQQLYATCSRLSASITGSIVWYWLKAPDTHCRNRRLKFVCQILAPFFPADARLLTSLTAFGTRRQWMTLEVMHPHEKLVPISGAGFWSMCQRGTSRWARAESNSRLLPGIRLASPAGWLPSICYQLCPPSSLCSLKDTWMKNMFFTAALSFNPN